MLAFGPGTRELLWEPAALPLTGVWGQPRRARASCLLSPPMETVKILFRLGLCDTDVLMFQTKHVL